MQWYAVYYGIRFYGAEVTTRARGGLVNKAQEHMYIIYNIRLGLIRITLDYFEDSFVSHFAYIEYRIHIFFQMGRKNGTSRGEVCRVEDWSGGLSRWRMGEGSQRFPKIAVRGFQISRSQPVFVWMVFWHVIAICHLWFGARFGDVSE